MSEWYLKNPDGSSSGPVASQAIMQGISAGQVTADSTVCAVGTNQWVPVTEIPIFLGALVGRGPGAAPPAAAPASAYGGPPSPGGSPSAPRQGGYPVPPQHQTPGPQQAYGAPS